MSYPTNGHATARRLGAVALVAAGCVTGCGLNGTLDAIPTPPNVATVAAQPVADETAAPELTPEAWAFVDAWWTAEQWDAAAGFARAVATYVQALRTAQAASYRPPVVYSAPHVAVRPAAPQTAWQPSTGTPPNGFLACVRNRESRGNYRAVNASSGAGGAYQFMVGTWNGYGGYARAELAPPAVQDAAAADLYRRAGRAPWAGPGC